MQPDILAAFADVVTVVSDRLTSGMVSVHSNASANSEDIYNATILSERQPQAQDIGLVLLIGGNRGHAYWIGRIPDVIADHRQPKTKPISGDIGMISEDGESILQIGANSLHIANKNTTVQADINKLTIQHNTATLELADHKANLIIGKNYLSLSDGDSHLYGSGSLYVVGNSMLQLATQGNCIVSGGLYDSENNVDFDKLGSVHNFLVKAQATRMSVGGSFDISAGAMNINLASAKMVGGIMPGTGSGITYKLNVVQGDLALSTGEGDILITSLNAPGGVGQYGIKLYTGNKPSGANYSSLELLVDSTKFKQFSPSGESSLKLSMGEATIDAEGNISLQSLTGEIKLQSTKDTTLTSLADVKINATGKLSITASGEMDITSPMLDLTQVQTINAGEKAVVPTGSGPFCALGQCVITGTPHSGSMAVG